MSRKYKFWDDEKLYFISCAAVYWIDIFTRKEYRDQLIDSWKYCQLHKGLEIYGWVIMPSHIHLIIGSCAESLERIVGGMKSYTSRQLRKCISGHPSESRKKWLMSLMGSAGRSNSNNISWQFWQQHNKPIEILDEKMFFRVLDYIHFNPVEAGFVKNPEDWLYSSAGDFHGKKGLIELHYIN